MKYKKPDYMITHKGVVRLLSDWETPYGTIPSQTESNGADVPWFLKWLISPYGWLLIPSIVHDYYYKKALKTKEYADSAFRQIGIDIGIPNWFMSSAYFFVKHFGKGNY